LPATGVWPLLELEELELDELELEEELLEPDELLLELSPGVSAVHAVNTRQAMNTNNRFLITAAPLFRAYV
jgi:hypothetical protein